MINAKCRTVAMSLSAEFLSAQRSLCFYWFHTLCWIQLSNAHLVPPRPSDCVVAGIRLPHLRPKVTASLNRAQACPAQNHLNFQQFKTMKSLFTACALALLAFSPVAFAAADSSCGCCTCDSCECESCNCCNCTACDC